MNENNLTKQEERALLELQCQLARLKVQTSRQRVQQQEKSRSLTQHVFSPVNVAQLVSDITQNNPLWSMAMTHGRGKQKLWLGAALILWQMWSNQQRK